MKGACTRHQETMGLRILRVPPSWPLTQTGACAVGVSVARTRHDPPDATHASLQITSFPCLSLRVSGCGAFFVSPSRYFCRAVLQSEVSRMLIGACVWRLGPGLTWAVASSVFKDMPGFFAEKVEGASRVCVCH